ncbi:hypothetical protein DMC01_07925 [Campylobacter troglodytis]|nr:hypothetical protein DMC01_07925 [Campylobacter troglodytis]
MCIERVCKISEFLLKFYFENLKMRKAKMSTKPNTAYTIMPKNKACTLQTTLKPNKIYSCFGIKIRVK